MEYYWRSWSDFCWTIGSTLATSIRPKTIEEIWSGFKSFLWLFLWRSQCVKSVQIQSFFWSIFSCIRTEYGVFIWASWNYSTLTFSWAVQLLLGSDSLQSYFPSIWINLNSRLESGFFVFCVMRNFLFFLILLFDFTPCSVATKRIQIKSNFSCLKMILWRPSSRLSKVLWRKNEKARKKLALIVTMISRIIRLTQLFTGPHEVFLWEKKVSSKYLSRSFPMPQEKCYEGL